MFKKVLYSIFILFFFYSCNSLGSKDKYPEWVFADAKIDDNSLTFSYFEEIENINENYICNVSNKFIKILYKSNSLNLKKEPKKTFNKYLSYIINDILKKSSSEYGVVNNRGQFSYEDITIYAVQIEIPRAEVDNICKKSELYRDFYKKNKKDLIASSKKENTLDKNIIYLKYLSDNNLEEYFDIADIFLVEIYNYIMPLEVIVSEKNVTNYLWKDPSSLDIYVINKDNNSVVDIDLKYIYSGNNILGDSYKRLKLDFVSKKNGWNEVFFPVGSYKGRDSITIKFDYSFLAKLNFGKMILGDLNRLIESKTSVVNRDVIPSSRSYSLGIVVSVYDIAKNLVDTNLTKDIIVSNLSGDFDNIEVFESASEAKAKGVDVLVGGVVDINDYKEENGSVIISFNGSFSIYGKGNIVVKYNFSKLENITGKNADIVYPVGYRIIGEKVSNILLNTLP